MPELLSVHGGQRGRDAAGAGPRDDSEPEWSDDIPIDRLHLTHRSSVHLTHWARTGPAEFRFTAAWPEARGGRAPVRTVHAGPDPMLVTATHRQAGLLIAHSAYAVPRTDATLLQRLNLTVDPDQPLPAHGPVALDVVARCAETGRRRGTPAGLRIETEIRHAGAPLARVDSDFSWMSRAVYRRLRGDKADAVWDVVPPQPVDPASVGRATTRDVLLAPAAPGRWQLRNETRNLLLFDHRVDHVPGLVLVEAAQQAARALAGPGFQPVSAANAFENYVELDEPCLIEATARPVDGSGAVTVDVVGRQAGQVCFRSAVSGRPPG
ncbi:ScbA/BarX family gamma-butyrolactone biosynthesis protein [Streptomyces kebangsaanensis]|uniref:ScbA/BarX family gamma-butyrolactone biosynthesis protein n=1 Tax=Streptomyces kebangsaanensis TaxID=864058 RepID=UPI0009A11724|nr:ScbA/BarX family gamma-butyrolactone biosynthesis protein [Streptomyces kebangsaanensis]